MKAIMLRTGSVSIQSSSLAPGSPRVSLSLHDSIGGAFSCNKTNFCSPRISLLSGVNRCSFRRVLSESDMIRAEIDVSGGAKKWSGTGSRSFRARIPEEEYSSEDDELRFGDVKSLTLAESGFDRRNYAGEWPGTGISVDKLGFPGDGTDNYRKSRDGGGDDFGSTGSADRSKIGAYYQEMLKLNPSDPLLLRNYGKYLHEVERDLVKAEEYYGRSILASPGDGEVLSLYGKLIWETQRDEDRAKSYFDQAVHVSPDDCMVLGSYAHFMWEAGEDEGVDEETGTEKEVVAAVVEAF